MHRTVARKGFVVLAAIPWLITALLTLTAISVCFYQGTKLVSRHDQLLSVYSFLEEDFSHEGKAGKDLRRVPLPGEFVKKELRQKEGPYFLLQKTILHVGSGKPLINRMEFVSAEEETPHDP